MFINYYTHISYLALEIHPALLFFSIPNINTSGLSQSTNVNNTSSTDKTQKSESSVKTENTQNSSLPKTDSNLGEYTFYDVVCILQGCIKKSVYIPYGSCIQRGDNHSPGTWSQFAIFVLRGSDGNSIPPTHNDHWALTLSNRLVLL